MAQVQVCWGPYSWGKGSWTQGSWPLGIARVLITKILELIEIGGEIGEILNFDLNYTSLMDRVMGDIDHAVRALDLIRQFTKLIKYR